MNEVASKVLHIWFRPIAAKGLTHEDMVAGTNVSLATLRSKKDRISWADFCAIHRNLRPHFTDDELVAVGRSYFRSPGLRFAFVIGRVLLTPLGFYRWMMSPRQGAGPQMFTCVVPTYRDISDHECEVELVLPDGYEVCWDFFLSTSGNFIEMPRLLGYPPAKVRLERIPRGGKFHITIQPRSGLLVRLRRALTWPFTVRAAARELEEAHGSLLDRFRELEDARATLDRQATQLRTAHAVNELVQRDLDLGRTIDTIARALVGEAKFAWSEIEVRPPEDGGPARTVTFGTKPEGAAEPLSRTLEARAGETIGVVRVVPAAETRREDAQELLEFIAPTLAMAVQNATTYQVLADYRSGLERLVQQRTAELRQAHDQLAGTVEELREAQGARERFFSNISHEIRTPLSLILLAAADIKARAGDALDDRARAGLGAVTDAARKLVRLVDELLLLAAGQEDKLRTNPEPTDLVALLGNLVSAWRPAAEVGGLEIGATLPEALIANVDPVAIERVATNLVSNAVKYTPAGGRIEIELAREPDGLRLSVLDTGAGISEELAGRLFGRFERGEDRRKTGTGIGLSLAKQLVEFHGGSIAALRRSDGPGSELRVVLPAACVMDAATAAPAVQRPRVFELAESPAAVAAGTRIAPPGVSQGTILIAEDDTRLADAIAQLLADEYTVVVAHDGATALELVRTHQPQLLVTDVEMPGLSGIELSKRFREATGDQLAPIIILSAMLDLGTRVAGLEAGAVDYITKPFDPVELKARLRAQFRMRDLALRLHRAEQVSSLGILTSGLAHELRNPANGVVNAVAPLAQLLPPELTAPETPVSQLLEVVETCAEQIAFLSRQLLGFRNGLALEMRPADIGEVIQRAVSFASHSLTGVDVRTELVCEGPLMCAPPLITQALTNLIENAAQAAGRGGWVEIRGRTSGATLLMEIGDSGPGVPAALRQRVFEPFFTTKPAGSGTGLGLSLARDIAVRHHGTIEIRERGGRTVFVLELPRSGAAEGGALRPGFEEPGEPRLARQSP